MNYLQGNIPFTQILIFVTIGLALFLTFNFIGRYIIRLIRKRTPGVVHIWQRIQIVTWSVYSVIFYSTLLRSYTSMTLILTFIVVALSWEYWRNIFAGVLIKFTGQFKEGDSISTKIAEGTLKSVFLSRAELLNDKGELVSVPNHLLRNQVVTHLRKRNDANICVFRIKATREQTLDDVYQMAYHCPYIAVNQDISVERKEEDVYVKATVIDNSFIEKVNRYFEHSLNFEEASKA